MSEIPTSPAIPTIKHADGTSTRRSVMRAAAWTVPVIALTTAAPAHAASKCVNRTNVTALTTGTLVTTIPFEGSGTPPVTATLSYAGYGGWVGSPTNGTVQDGPQGGNPANLKWIKFENAHANSGSGLNVRLVFSEPVENLSFTLFDLDWAPGNHRDAVNYITAPTSSQRASELRGDGSAGNPWRKRDEGEIPSTSLNGNVKLTYAGPISQVEFRYFQYLENLNGDHNQLIGLSDLTFDKCL